MQSVARVSVCLVAAASASNDAVPGPIAKVLEMIANLEQKIIGEGDKTQASYEEYSEFCEDRNKELVFEVKTGKAETSDLKASILKSAADIDELSAKIDDLAAASATNEKDLKKATGIRKKEASSFQSSEKDLVDTIDTLSRASGIIEREMAKGSSFAQLSGTKGLLSALDTLVQAQMIKTADGEKLSSLLQSFSASASDNADEDEEDSMGSPAAAVTENKSGGILDALADLQSKAEDELSEARQEEAKAQQNFDMKKQAITDELKFAAKDMDEAKKSKAKQEESKAEAEGQLETASKDLSEDQKALSELHAACMSRASDFEAETRSRGEELKALATAKKLITEATAFDQVSFLQVASSTMEAVHIVRDLAFNQHSTSLARLASRMDAASKSSANPFGKVMGMINDMIAKLEAEAESEAGQKAFCDKSLGEANAKKDEATTAIDKLDVKIEQGAAKSTKLKEQVTVLQAELAKLMATTQQMDMMREKENTIYKEEKAELDKGLKGIQTALKVLRDYYASGDGQQGAGGGIISLLEVCESDISKELAEIVAVEENAAAAYTAETKENALIKMTKDKDVEYKNKEIAALAKADTEHKTDLSAVQTELDAVMAGLAQLEKQCLGKAESYASKVAKQKAEVDGLKSALASLGGASLVQTGRRVQRHVVLRGSA